MRYDHLKDSLDLALAVLERYKSAGIELDEEEEAMVDQIASFASRKANAGTAAADDDEAPVTNVPPLRALSGELSSPPSSHLPMADSNSRASSAATPQGASGGDRIKGLINKLRKAADSGALMKELVKKSEAVDGLAALSLKCAEASRERTVLADTLIHGICELAINPESSKSVLKASMNPVNEFGSLHNLKESVTQDVSTTGISLYFLQKSYQVLENPLTQELIGGITTEYGESARECAVDADESATSVDATPRDGHRKRSAADSRPHSTSGINYDLSDSMASNTMFRAQRSDGFTQVVTIVNPYVEQVRACFNSKEINEHDGHLFLPFVVDSEAVGVGVVYGWAEVLSQNRMQILSAIQGLSAVSIRNLTLNEDLVWQHDTANAMLAMAERLTIDNIDERSLTDAIIKTAKQLTEADRCSVFVVRGDKMRAYFENNPNPVVIPKHAGIAGHVASTGEVVNIEDAYLDDRFNRSVDKQTGYRTRSILCMPIHYNDQIIGVAQLINKKSIFRAVNTPSPNPAASMARRRNTVRSIEITRSFSRRDEDLFANFSTFVGASLRACRITQNLREEREKSDAILEVVTVLSQTDIRDVNAIVGHVMLGARRLLHADRASLFLVDKEQGELYSEVADSTAGQQIRFPIGTGIAGTVAATGEAENIHDAYHDTRFNRDVDLKLGYRTKSILCEPIVLRGEVLAIAQLINKLDTSEDDIAAPSTASIMPSITSSNNNLLSAKKGSTSGGGGDISPNGSISTLSTSLTVKRKSFSQTQQKVIPFTEKDQETFRTFARFAGISISNSHLLRFAVQAGEELIALNARMDNRDGDGSPFSRRGSLISSPPIQRITDSERAEIMSIDLGDMNFTSADFNIFAARENATKPSDTAVAIIWKLMMSTGLPQMFDCDEETMLNFILHCRKKYRKVPYHNFFHVVDVCQTLYTFLFQGDVRDFLTDLDCYVLLITALVHDLDHMGVNNSFHLKTDSPLGILSSASGNTSVLEVHHCNLAIEILEDPTANIFSGLSTPERSEAYKAMIEAILATDMARHGDLVKRFEATIAENAKDESNEFVFNKDDPLHRKVVREIALKAADISNVTKPFEVSRLWAVAVTEEFYQQGDKEKAKGVEVLPMFDRSQKTELAKGQLGFINFVAEKFFTTVIGLGFRGMQFALDNLANNKKEWNAILEADTPRP